MAVILRCNSPSGDVSGRVKIVWIRSSYSGVIWSDRSSAPRVSSSTTFPKSCRSHALTSKTGPDQPEPGPGSSRNESIMCTTMALCLGLRSSSVLSANAVQDDVLGFVACRKSSRMKNPHWGIDRMSTPHLSAASTESLRTRDCRR